MDKLLEIKDLTVKIGERYVTENVNVPLYAGSITALVGESGSGKTITALSVLKILPETASIERGEILFSGKDLLKTSEAEMRGIRGKRIAMVFQEPFAYLNPVMRIGEQIGEVIRTHEGRSKKDTLSYTEYLLKTVKLSSDTALSYPHEMSGGMCQRAMIAMALACDPEVLILDEPTTALDVSVQKDILDLIVKIQREKLLGILFITHDLSVVSMIADSVHIMKEGRILEFGSKEKVLNDPGHAYTRHLIACIPRLGDKRERLAA
ncbi:MAG: ABC transporter ATP-binding protein [Candidatus Omnitrophota bacterium]|nr:ABC transporter ATP-binding protein [Candidatus Omnitrophota bacterium]